MSIDDEDFEELIAAIISKVGNKSVCSEHSGLKAWVQLGCGLLTILVGLFSYSSFVQGPQLKTSLDQLSAATEKRFYAVERDVADLKSTDSKIINQLNVYHPTLGNLQ